MLHSHRRVSPISRFAANDRDPRADSRFPAKAGNGGFPDSRFRPNRESGIPSPILGQIGNRGNGNWGFPGLVPTRRRSRECQRQASHLITEIVYSTRYGSELVSV